MSIEKLLTRVTSLLRRVAAPLGIAVAIGGSGAATADWLVLTSGEAVETKGPWTVEGAKVVFTNSRGVLSSVRSSEVNVESSRALTSKKLHDAGPVAAATPTPKRTPVLVLTDKDFAKATPAGPAAAPAEAGAPVAAAPAEGGAPVAAAPAGAPGVAVPAEVTAGTGQTKASRAGAGTGQPVVVPAADSLETRVAQQMPGPPALRVTNWSARPTGEDLLSIFGTVQNVGSRVTAAITVEVTLFDSEGTKIGTEEGVVSSTALMPDASANFEAKFDGDPNFAEVQLKVKTVEIEVGKPKGEALEEPVGDEPHATAKGAPAKPPDSAAKPPAATTAKPPSAPVKPQSP